MKFTYEDVSYDFDEKTLTNKEVMALEAQTGLTFGEIAKLGAERRVPMRVTTAIVWVALRREHPGTKFDDIEFVIDQAFQPDEVPEEPPDPTRAEGEPSLSEPLPDPEATPEG